ncbi:MAG: HD domain-containing protein [Desulfatiglandaceae bacterium]
MEKTLNAEPVDHLWIKDIEEGGRIRGRYVVREKRLSNTKKGDPFLTLTLADRTGDVEAKVWDQVETLTATFGVGDILGVEGKATSYRGRVQLTLTGIEVVDGDVDPSLFLESSGKSSVAMMARLRKILQEMENTHLKGLMDRFLGDRRFVSLFEKAPAAKNFHHNYVGGLLEHTLSVCLMAVGVAEHYPQLDRDLLLAGAFLHDIGKVRELNAHLTIEYTDEGRLVGHLVQGTLMVEEKLARMKHFPADLAVRLKHLILSHHGEYAFGSPKRPKFLEAFVLHLLDDLDAKVNGLGRLFEKDGHEGAWTEYSRLFDRFFLKGNMAPAEEGTVTNDAEEDQQGTLF